MSLMLLSLGIFILVFLGYGVGVRDKIRNIEGLYSPLMESDLSSLHMRNISYVVVLGSGHVSGDRLPFNSQIGGAALFRLVEGIRIHKKLNTSVLVLCGGRVYDPVPHAVITANVARVLGVSGDNIVIKDQPKDTIQEADSVLPLVGKREFILVTSALLMPRALRIFKEKGMNPIPSPTDYIFKDPKNKTPSSLLPNTANLDLSKRLIYEWIGNKWATIKLSLKNYL